MKKITFILSLLFLTTTQAAPLPSSYTELLDFVQPGPHQGKTGTCLFVASTGAMELLANKLHDIRNPKEFGPYDLSEPYLIHAPYITPPGKSFFEGPVYKFNQGFGISAQEWLFVAWDEGRVNRSAWANQDYSRMTPVPLPEVETIKLFNKDNRYATNVLDHEHIQEIKEALVKYKSPVLVNYKDNKYWHVILIVGYDNKAEGECYQISEDECQETRGSFYVRDSFGKVYELRDYDWFKAKGNAAFVVKTVED